MVGPPPPHVQRPERPPEQRRHCREPTGLDPPPVERPPRTSHQLHPRPVLRLPPPEGGPSPALPYGPLPPRELAEGDDLGREAAPGAEATPLGLDPLRGVGAEGQHDLRRGELLEVAAVLGAGDEGVLRPAQGYVRDALRFWWLVVGGRWLVVVVGVGVGVGVLCSV